MKLSRASAYAISALQYLSKFPSDTPVSCRRLAALGSLPERFLLQVMRSLVLHGIVRSIRGVEGGYILAKPVCDISLLHVIEATGSDISPEMPDVEAMPTNTKHRLSAILKGINAGTVKHLASVSLADLGAAPTKLNLGELAGGFVPIDTPTETGS